MRDLFALSSAPRIFESRWIPKNIQLKSSYKSWCWMFWNILNPIPFPSKKGCYSPDHQFPWRLQGIEEGHSLRSFFSGKDVWWCFFFVFYLEVWSSIHHYNCVFLLWFTHFELVLFVKVFVFCSCLTARLQNIFIDPTIMVKILHPQLENISAKCFTKKTLNSLTSLLKSEHYSISFSFLIFQPWSELSMVQGSTVPK